MTKREQAVTNALIYALLYKEEKHLIEGVLCTMDKTPYYLRVVESKKGTKVQLINQSSDGDEIDAVFNESYDKHSIIEAIAAYVK